LPQALDYSPPVTSSACSIVVALALFAGGLPLTAAGKAETKTFTEAAQAFRDGFWERAERELGAYLERYPNAENRAEAVLLRAEARLKLKNYPGAIELLNAGRATAGNLADEYLFWLAEANFQSGKTETAAELYAQFAADFAHSPRLLEAVVAEASLRASLKQWPRVIEVLQPPEGLFQSLAKATPTQAAAVRGRFLLAEALHAQGRFAEVENALAPLANEKLSPQFAWQRDQLRARAALAGGQPAQTVGLASNLLTLITNQPALTAEALALVGRSQEALGQPDAAIAAWKQNLASTTPPERQREALLHVGELLGRQGRLTEAAQMMEQFLGTATNSPAADLAWLTLGEVRLRHIAALTSGTVTNAASGSTNQLPLAMSAFDTLLQRFPESRLAGRAQLGRGWCFWLERRFGESKDAFQQAAAALPAGYKQAVARFKLGDAQMQQQDFAGALTNYLLVARNPDGLPEIRSNLVERALCQAVRAAGETGDAAAANAAMAQLLEQFPEGALTQDALLLAGDSRSATNNPAARREVLTRFLEKAPDSKLAAGVRLALARTYEQECDWPRAEAEYATWLKTFPDDPAQPRAEYARALALARTGDETNALTLFTNFVARFPTNDLTPPAQWWIADHYWRQEDFVNAERNYQLLFKTAPQSPLRFEAQLMAGRAAIARQRPEEAIGYFTNLLSGEVNVESNLTAQAMFAYGDTLMLLPAAESNQSLVNFRKAIQVFSKLVQLYPDTRIALLAQGKIGDCYLQLGTADPGQYAYARNAYRQILASSLAKLPEFSQAEVGLGLALERESQLAEGTNAVALARSALDHYLNVVYGQHQRADEPPDLFWMKRAGLEALRLTESLQAWEQVAKLCDTLGTLLPPLQPLLEKKRARALEQLGKAAD
jgi:TolA-binding protein